MLAVCLPIERARNGAPLANNGKRAPVVSAILPAMTSPQTLHRWTPY
jgi:hypothetical protein